MQKVVFNQIPNADLKLVIKLLQDQRDYDADAQKPVAGVYIKDRPEGEYLRRLEDIDESWVRKYLENTLTGLKINKSGGLREYAKQNQEARTFSNREGETVEEGELLVDYNAYSPMSVAEAKSKLPYLLKRLFDKSITLRVSTMSLIIAYEKAKLISKVPRPKDILEFGVYRMGKDGNIDGVFPESANSGKVFPPACDWIRGFVRDSYFDDAMELIRVCEILGIDIKEEDPYEYQAVDIAKLKVTYISKNRDYLSGARQRNPNVLDSLSTISISDYATVQRSQTPISLRVFNTIQSILDCDNKEIREILKQSPDAVSLNRFFQTYSAVAKDFMVIKQQALAVPILDDFITIDGFLYSARNLTVPQLFRVKRYVEEGTDGEIAIAHVSGYLFLITESCYIYYLEAGELGEYIKDYQRNVFTNRYQKNHKYGRWDSCFV